MSRVIILPHFMKELKPLVKKYPSLKEAVITVLDGYDSAHGVHLGHDLYKVRLASPELKRGKSKAFRLIVLALVTEDALIPVTGYFKGDQDSISHTELNRHLESILFELSEEREG